MSITCNNSSSAIRSKYSNEYFTSIIKKINFIDDHELILSIYKKIKTLRPITLEEEKLFLSIVESREFIIRLSNLINTLDIPENKISDFKTTRFIDSIHSFITKCRVIDILNKSNEFQITTINDSDSYFKIIENNEKNIYLELLDQQLDFILGYDIKAGKYKIINKITSVVLLESKEEIEIFSYEGINRLIFVESLIEGGKKYAITNNFSITFSKESIFFEGKFDYIFIDKKSSQIYLIDKKSLDLKIRDYSGHSILSVFGDNILFYLRSTNLLNIGDDSGNSDFTPGNLFLYNIQKNKDIINNLDQRFFYSDKDFFIGLSFDHKYIEIYNFNSSKLITENFSQMNGYSIDNDIETNFNIVIKNYINKSSY